MINAYVARYGLYLQSAASLTPQQEAAVRAHLKTTPPERKKQ